MSCYFVKYAGAPTEAYDGTAQDAINRLKSIPPIYRDLRHPNLIQLIDTEEIGNGFSVIFKWADGDCMGRMYNKAKIIRRFHFIWQTINIL